MSRVLRDGTSIIINAAQKHTATIILAHGLGDSASGWKDAAMEMSGQLPYVKWILPTAPSNPVTLNGGMRMNSWYDIESLSKSREQQNCAGLDESCQIIMDLVQKENAAGISTSRIILAGFSQGGALSLWTGLQFPKSEIHPTRLAGVIVLSGYLPRGHAFSLSEHGKSTPVLHCHGTVDSVVTPEYSSDSKKHVVEAGHSAGYDLRMYPGLAHSASMQELTEVTQWISKILPNV